MDRDFDHDRPSDADKNASPRRPYTPPRLTEYGSIAKLTRSQGSTIPEGLRPHMQPCL
jgi:hypothetical protein